MNFGVTSLAARKRRHPGLRDTLAPLDRSQRQDRRRALRDGHLGICVDPWVLTVSVEHVSPYRCPVVVIKEICQTIKDGRPLWISMPRNLWGRCPT